MQLKQIGTITLITCCSMVSNCFLEPVASINIAVAQSQRQQPQPEYIAQELLQQGVYQYNQQKIAEAIESWQQALYIYGSINDLAKQAKVLGNLGTAYYSLGEYDLAIEYYQQRLKIFQEIGNRYGEGDTLNSLGRSYQTLREYDLAIEYYQQSLEIAREKHIRQGEAITLTNLGDIYLEIGHYTLAIEYYQQSLEIAEASGDRYIETQSLIKIAIAYNYLEDYGSTTELLSKSLTIAEAINDAKLQVDSANALGRAYNHGQMIDKAMEYHEQSLEIAENNNLINEQAISLNNLGTVYFELKKYQQAENLYRQSLEIAKEINNKRLEGEILQNIGKIYVSQKQSQEAIEYLESSLNIAKETNNIRSQDKAYYNLALALLETGELQKAEEILKEGIKFKEDHGDKWGSYVSIKEANLYRLLQKILRKQQKVEAALEIAEFERGMLFMEVLSQRTKGIKEIEPPQPLNIEQMQAIARREKATIVEYSVIDANELYIWVIKPEGNISFRTVELDKFIGNSSLEELVRATIEAIRTGNKQEQEYLQRLYQLLIKPINTVLPNKSEELVIFIPQDSLFFVPFAALQDSSNRYIIEKYTLLTAPAIQVLENTGSPQLSSPEKSMLIVGNSHLVPGAAEETEAIAALFDTQGFTDQEASKGFLLTHMSTSGMIHLATQGIFNEIQGLKSSIVLAADLFPSPEESNAVLTTELTAEEILEINLQAELFVISGSDIAKVKITGNGMVGLSRSLLNSGVNNVVISLWSTPNAPRLQLMEQLYTHWSGNYSIAQSLRQAMLTNMENYPSPRDWAAFTIIQGESRGVGE